MFGCKRRAYVFRRPEEKMILDCVVPTVKHGGRSIMVWGCIGRNSVGDLIKIEGILKKEHYLSILRDHVIPSGRRLIGQNFIFMHNNDPKHTARVCKDYLQHLEQSDELKIIHWPPQSPDLNPIEKIWDESDWKIREVCPKSQNDLWNKLQNAWNQIVPETIEKLIKRMPKLVEKIIKKRGG